MHHTVSDPEPNHLSHNGVLQLHRSLLELCFSVSVKWIHWGLTGVSVIQQWQNQTSIQLLSKHWLGGVWVECTLPTKLAIKEKINGLQTSASVLKVPAWPLQIDFVSSQNTTRIVFALFFFYKIKVTMFDRMSKSASRQFAGFLYNHCIQSIVLSLYRTTLQNHGDCVCWVFVLFVTDKAL